MEAGQRMRLEAVMETMALRNPDGLFNLHREFWSPLAASLQCHLRRMGVDRIGEEDLDGLVLDACIVLFDVAPSWKPDGSLPWVWVHPRLIAVVTRFVGLHADHWSADQLDQLQESVGAPVVAPVDGDPLRILDGLGADDPLCHLLAEAFEEVGSARDRTILLEVKMQAQSGDPSPAVTVGAELGMRPEAVRQATHRARRRLREAIAREPRFRPLADLALLS